MLQLLIPLLWFAVQIEGFVHTQTQKSVRLWASDVTKFSSQYDNGVWSAKQVLGKPNVFPRYGDIGGTWAQRSNQLDRVHFIEVKFPRKIFIAEVNIFETYHAGAVVKISVKDGENQWVDIYNVSRAKVIGKARKFSPRIKRVMFPADELRIEVDCSASKSYVEIDAIEIVGEIQASIHLWASEVTRFSSQYNNGGYSAKQVLGKPNVYPRYGDSAGTWTQASGQLNTVHFIEVKFPRKIFIDKVNIFETYHAGAVVKISAKDRENRWVDIYNVYPAHVIKKSRKFSPRIKRTMFPVDELRIEVDCSASRSYVEIDAIEIVGDSKRCPPPFSYYEKSSSCYFIKKDAVSGDKAFVRCLQIGGYLANFETLEEALLMKSKLLHMKTGISYYVGGRNINRRKPGGDWRWIKQGTMTKMSYFAFAKEEPSGTVKSPEDCMLFNSGHRYKFHDVPCDNGYNLGGYICEI